MKIYKITEASRLLSSLELKTYVNRIQLLGDILFCRYKMNKMVNTMLLAGVNFMMEMHLRQPIFTYSARILFTENKKWIQKL